MSLQLLSFEELRAFYIQCQWSARHLKDEEDRKKYFELLLAFNKEMNEWSRPATVLLAAKEIYDFLAKHFADLETPTEAENKRLDRLNRSFDKLQASLRDEMNLTPQQRANVKVQFKKASDYTHGINPDGTKATFHKYLSYGVATNPSDIKTVIAIKPTIEFQNYHQRNTVIVNKALSGFPPRANVYVIGLDHYGSWSPVRWLPHSLFGSDKPNGRSAVGSRWRDQEAYALAVDLTLKGFRVQNLDKLPKADRNRIKKLEEKYEKEMKKAEQDKLKVSEEPQVSLGKRPN